MYFILGYCHAKPIIEETIEKSNGFQNVLTQKQNNSKPVFIFDLSQALKITSNHLELKLRFIDTIMDGLHRKQIVMADNRRYLNEIKFRFSWITSFFSITLI